MADYQLLTCCEYNADDNARILSFITTLKSRLEDIIEPDFGLLDELLRLDVLSRRQYAKVRSERTVFERNDALLDLLTSEEQCVKFVYGLQRTGQPHVANFIMQNGGEKLNDIVTYQLNIALGDKQTTVWRRNPLHCTRRISNAYIL